GYYHPRDGVAHAHVGTRAEGEVAHALAVDVELQRLVVLIRVAVGDRDHGVYRHAFFDGHLPHLGVRLAKAHHHGDGGVEPEGLFAEGLGESVVLADAGGDLRVLGQVVKRRAGHGGDGGYTTGE